MAKFAIVCPHCGTSNKASTFIFARKSILCGNCKNEINIKANRMVVGNCKNCGSIAFDQAKGVCPICKEKIEITDFDKATSVESLKKSNNTPLFLCPYCGCDIQASKQGGELFCPVCDYKFDGYEEVFKEISKSKLVTESGISVIKYEGDNQTFVWKHPIEDFNTGTQLLVHESQDAIFFLNGQALDTFSKAGRYTLETENLPLLKKVYDLPTGKQNPFHAEVYFINKTVQMGIKWGTDTRVEFSDPLSGIPLDMAAHGEMNLQVSDSRKLLIKLVGTTGGIAWENDNAGFTKKLRDMFKSPISTIIKSNLGREIEDQKIDILRRDSALENLSNAIRPKLAAAFEEYGLTIPQFYINELSLEDCRNYKKLIDFRGAGYLGTREYEIRAEIERSKRDAILEEKQTELQIEKLEAEKKIIKAKAEAEGERLRGYAEADVMKQKGYTEKDVMQTEVQGKLAESIGKMGGGSGGAVSDAAGLGVAIATMGMIGEKAKDLAKSMSTSDNGAVNGWKCAFCGTEGNTGKCCSECGRPKADSAPWKCASCGNEGNTGKCCSECGRPKADSAPWKCASCGNEGNTGKCCSECGKSKENN